MYTAVCGSNGVETCCVGCEDMLPAPSSRGQCSAALQYEAQLQAANFGPRYNDSPSGQQGGQKCYVFQGFLLQNCSKLDMSCPLFATAGCQNALSWWGQTWAHTVHLCHLSYLTVKCYLTLWLTEHMLHTGLSWCHLNFPVHHNVIWIQRGLSHVAVPTVEQFRVLENYLKTINTVFCSLSCRYNTSCDDFSVGFRPACLEHCCRLEKAILNPKWSSTSAEFKCCCPIVFISTG